MSARRTRKEAMDAEEQAVRLRARGLSDREIGRALNLSESEARRKRLLGMERRRRDAEGVDAWAMLEADLTEAKRVAYNDHDAAPAGSPARVGCLKVILHVGDRLARLRGLDPGRAAAATSAGAAGAAEHNKDANLRDAYRAADERMRHDARAVLNLERAAGPENVRPPEPEETFSEGRQSP